MFITELASRAHLLAREEVPEAVETRVRIQLADTVGALLIGADTFAPRANALADALGLGGGAGADPVLRARRGALIGGTLVHAWEIDDLHPAAVLCPGCVVLPALAGSVHRVPGVSWGEFRRATLIGYEIAVRAALHADPAALIASGWWPTGTFGPVGGAAALSVLLGRDLAATESAIAIAAQLAGGVIAGSTDHADSRLLLAGTAAERAVLGEAAASAGITGAADVMDVPRSPLRPRSDPGPHGERATDYVISATGFKGYPAANHLQAAIELVLELRGTGLRADDVVELECSLPSQIARVVDRPAPFPSVLSALVSAQFILATAVLRGRLGTGDFGDDERTSPAVLALAARIRVLPDDELAEAYPSRWGAVITVVTATGRQTTRRESARSALEPSRYQLLSKYRAAAGDPDSRSASDAAAAIERVLDADDTESAESVLSGPILLALGIQEQGALHR